MSAWRVHHVCAVIRPQSVAYAAYAFIATSESSDQLILVGCRWRPTPIFEFSAKNAAWLLTKGAIVLKFVCACPEWNVPSP
jgi:hypothetical protein